MADQVSGFTELAGKVVVVTGGGSGIGAALARGFGRCGSRVFIHYHRSGSQRIAELSAAIEVDGGEAQSLAADLTTAAGCSALVEAIREGYGRLDVLVNNAGSMVARRRLEELDDAFLDRVFDLNARSVVRLSQAALPFFDRQGQGCIINFSSISGRTGGSPGSSVYSASKAFVSTLTRALARELAERRVRVNAISPGTIDTPFHEQFSTPEKLEKTRSGIPLQRLGNAEDCVGTALYLASDALSGYVTGQVIEVNGGQLMA